MTLLFFSGGIDSTVLAFDVAKNPHRYGISENQEADLTLFTYAKNPAKKKKELAELQKAIEKVSRLRTFWNIVKCDLQDDVPYPIPIGGMKTTTPSVGSYDWDRKTMPYTSGLMVWLASWAMNLTWNDQVPQGRPQAFFGFQFENPEWCEYDEGRDPPNDTSPKFIRALNKLTEEAGERPVFRAPFLENRMDRYMIVRMGQELGVPLHLTSSCIGSFDKECGICSQCIKRHVAFKSAGVRHGT